MGSYDAAAASFAEALRLARVTGQDTLAANSGGMLAVLAAMVGDRPACRRVRRYGARGGPPALGVQGSRSQALAEWVLAILDMVAGRPDRALARLVPVMATAPGDGHVVVQVSATPHFVEAAVRCDARPAAAAALRLFDPWAVSTGNPDWLALAARCRALMATGHDEAFEHFGEAMRQHRHGRSDFQLARTALLFGQELRRAKRPGVAREHLSCAASTFARFDAAPWVDRAVAELRAAGGQVGGDKGQAGDDSEPAGGGRRTATAAMAVLTPQQAQIAGLVADGATNREVAERLSLSPRTVDHHLRNIFSRLGVRSRTELAALLTRGAPSTHW